MERVAPVGDVYQAGTLSGNPLAVCAGIAALKKLRRPGFYESLEARAGSLATGLAAAAAAEGVDVFWTRVASMLCGFFTREPVTDYATASRSDIRRFAQFHQQMLARGIYLAPSQFEALFVSAAHKESDVETTVRAARESFAYLAKTPA